ncbi:MAG: DUF4234 domain-containing protein [Myxococcales bacterium]|nr:DUF4234 domain-containing protein [Myxococcales bacterium]
MKNRSIGLMILYTFLTFGIYGIYWYVSTKTEMVELGAEIPTAWLLIVPIANIYWIWKWAGGVEHVTKGKMSQVIAFILVALLSIVGVVIVQLELNKQATA